MHPLPTERSERPTFCTLPGGSPAQELLVTITGLKLTTSTPAVVLVPPRQAASQNLGHPDAGLDGCAREGQCRMMAAVLVARRGYAVAGAAREILPAT